ncbi:MAG: hypothetical protein IJ087_10010 [Eggerthellaceae bacterium]|nr:hypothetical protein [Eggerthellaceae bacterium]
MFAIAIGIGVLALCLLVGVMTVDSQPHRSAQLHNAYWPYSVETQIRDK